MSEPIAIQAPQPSTTGSSRIGTAGFAIGIAIVALVVAAARRNLRREALG